MYEMISKIQTMRKESGFEVTDHIRLSFLKNDMLAQIAMSNQTMMMEKVLADEMNMNTTYAFLKEWSVNGETVEISIEKCE